MSIVNFKKYNYIINKKKCTFGEIQKRNNGRIQTIAPEYGRRSYGSNNYQLDVQ